MVPQVLSEALSGFPGLNWTINPNPLHTHLENLVSCGCPIQEGLFKKNSQLLLLQLRKTPPPITHLDLRFLSQSLSKYTHVEAVPQGDRLATAVVTKHCPAGTSSITKGAPEVLSAPLWRAGPVRSAVWRSERSAGYD